MLGSIVASLAAFCVLAFLLWRSGPLLSELRSTLEQERDLS